MSISHPQIDVNEAASGTWFGAREEAQLPVRSEGNGWSARHTDSRDAAPSEGGARVWMRRALRALLDLAIVIAAMAAVPVLSVTQADGSFWRAGFDVANARYRSHGAEAARAFMGPADPSVTPLDAGRSLLALQGTHSSQAFPTQDVPAAAATWRSLTMSATMFPTARPSPSPFHGPNSSSVLEAAAKGFSADELAYLRTLATSPAWREFDRVAQAPAIDMIGGQFRLPLSRDAMVFEVPIVRFGTLMELSQAAVSRAAYHLAIGQRDSAEAVLRSIVSFGFRIADNGPELVEDNMGRSVVAIGTEALERYYVITNNAASSAVRAARDDMKRAGAPPRGVQSTDDEVTVDQMRRELIKRADDPNELRGIRYESLELLSMAPCTNVREMLFGPRADVRDAFERAKRDLARYPSEQALIELIQRTPTSQALFNGVISSPMRRFLVGTSAIAGAALHNPRLTGCTLIATEGRLH